MAAPVTVGLFDFSHIKHSLEFTLNYIFLVFWLMIGLAGYNYPRCGVLWCLCNQVNRKQIRKFFSQPGNLCSLGREVDWDRFLKDNSGPSSTLLGTNIARVTGTISLHGLRSLSWCILHTPYIHFSALTVDFLNSLSDLEGPLPPNK